MAKKVWWVQLTTKVKWLCRYLQKHKNDLPVELRIDAQVFLNALVSFCDVLILYDKNNARGKGE